jgi:hypothetical protein
MKIVVAATALALTTLASRSASACGVPDFGMILSDVAKAFETKTTPVHTPIVIAGGGTSSEGGIGSVAVGYAWGKHEETWLFPGSIVSRALVNLRTNTHDATAVAATYGWYQNQVASAGIDLGVEAELSGMRGIGPTGRLTLGLHGLAVQLTAGAMFGGDQPRFEGSTQVVVEVMDLTGIL